MHTENFTASTQYSDLKGSVAADRGDDLNAREWLNQRGLLQENEHILGIQMFAGENHGQHRDPVHVSFLLAPAENARKVYVPGGEAVPTVVRRVRVDMSVHEFFALFKRFEVCLSSNGQFDGHPFSYPDY